MSLAYNIGIAIYAQAVRCVARFNPKADKLVKGHKLIQSRLEKALASRADRKVVWFHAASLGEFEQGRPLMERLKAERPDTMTVLTFFSPSGYEIRSGYDKADVVTYLPFDTPGRVRRFLDTVRPDVAVFIKYEFWANYLYELRKRGVKAYLISAIFRPRQSFFKWWGAGFRRMLRNFTHLYVQDRNSADMLSGIGIKNVTVAGDTRFDRVAKVRQSPCRIPGLDDFASGAETVFVAGSSWPADEDVYIPWLHSHPEVKFIIAPHEFNASRLALLLGRLPGDVMLLSQWAKRGYPETVRGIVVDNFGHLSTLYRFGHVAYIGGGFGAGIHNINEAAVYGMPVVFGPKHSKFKEASDLIECKGGFSITDTAQFNRVMDYLLNDRTNLKTCGKAAGNYIERNLGASDRIFNDILKSL